MGHFMPHPVFCLPGRTLLGFKIPRSSVSPIPMTGRPGYSPLDGGRSTLYSVGRFEMRFWLRSEAGGWCLPTTVTFGNASASAIMDSDISISSSLRVLAMWTTLGIFRFDQAERPEGRLKPNKVERRDDPY